MGLVIPDVLSEFLPDFWITVKLLNSLEFDLQM